MNRQDYDQLFVFLERLVWKQEEDASKHDLSAHKLDVIIREQREIKKMVVDFTALINEVKATQDVEASAVAVIQDIAQKIADAVAADETGVSTEVADLAAQLQTSADALAAAVATTVVTPPVANT